MPVTSHQKYSDGKLTLSEIRKQETTDPDGNPVKFFRIICNYDHPKGSGTVRGKPYFELCPFSLPGGMVKEKDRLSGFTIADINETEVRECVDTPERSEISGWVRNNKNAISVDKGFKTSTATALDDVTVYNTCDDDRVEIATLSVDTVMNIEDESEDGNWLAVVVSGKESFFSKIYSDIAKIVFDNRASVGLASLRKLEDVKARIKAPFYWHRNKDGSFIDGKNPSTYFKYSYFGATPAKGDKPARPESYCNFTPVGMSDSLGLDVLLSQSIDFRPVINLNNIYIGAGKITPQFYVTSAVVTGISKKEQKHLQQETLDRYNQNEALVAKMKEDMAKLKIEKKSPSSSPTVEAEEAPNSEPVPEENQTPNLEDMLSGGPVMSSVDVTKEDNSGADDDDLEIPGLPTL